MPRSKPGKSLEALVSSIERVLARNDHVTIESPKLVRDRITGESREHDVVITLTGGHHKSTIAIECRDRSRKVTVNEVESFWSKCQDTGIDQGIIVSSRGFAKTAITKSLHRGIRCLRLSEANSFNWLLATGIHIRHRKMVHTNWTFYPEKDLFPTPTTFAILSRDGEQIPSENLAAAVYKEFQKLADVEFNVGCGTKKIVFMSPGLMLRDDSTGNTYAVTKALAAIDYEIIEEFVPFNLVTYGNNPSGDLIADAAVARVDLGALKGKVMIVYKQSEGGNVVFIPDNDTQPSVAPDR